jgi:hypothetical protein
VVRGMVDELDVYRTAQLLVNLHGTEAPIHAAKRCDHLAGRGDLDGAAVWKRVLSAVDVLLCRARSNAAHLH